MGVVRLVLALSVIAAHCGSIFGSSLVGGQIAVQSFYIISGFYMSLILKEKYIGVNNSYRLFITNRFIRLYPIYWTVLIVTILVCLLVALATKGHSFPKFDSYSSVKTNLLSFAFLILTNLLIFGQDVVMFLGISPATGNLFFTSNFWNTSPPLHSFLFVPQAWTLGLELTFYLVAPFILKRGLKVVVTLIALSFLLRLIIYNYFSLQNDPWTYRFFPTEIMFFLSGYLSYQIHLLLKKKSLSNHINLFTLIFTLALTILYEFLPSVKISWFPFSGKELLYFSTIILSIPILFNWLKKSRIDSQIGELSYPVYISHMLVFGICFAVGSQSSLVTFKEGWFISLATIIFAYFLNKVVASPIEKYRQSRLKNNVSR